MTQEVLHQQTREAFLEAEKFVSETGRLVEMVVPSADGPELYHINVLGPGKGMGNIDYRIAHKALKDIFGDRISLLNGFIDSIQTDNTLPDQHSEWPFLSRESQRPLVLKYDTVDQPVQEFWSIRGAHEAKNEVS